MDFNQFLCGLSQVRLRDVGFLPRAPKISMPNLPNLWNLPNLPNLNFSNLPIIGQKENNKPHRKHLPVGTGEHTVACLDLMSNHTREGTFIRLYYPTYKTDIFHREAQWPLWLPRKQYGKGYAYFKRKNTKFFGALFNLIGGDWYVPVLWQAPVLENGTKFPVVIFSHGLGGNRTTYTTVCSDLASHGYIVAAIEHRDGTASMTFCLRPTENEETDSNNEDYRFLYRNYSFREEHWLKYDRQEDELNEQVRNKQVHLRVKEIQRLLTFLEDINEGKIVDNVLSSFVSHKQFKGVMDFERLGVMGHSFGGGTAVAALAADKRFKVAIGLDSWFEPLEESLYTKVNQPVLLLNSDTFQWKRNVQDMYKLKMNEDGNLYRVLLTLKGTCHQTQTDFQFMVPSKVAKMMGMRHSLDPHTAMDINNRAVRGFLAKHLDIADCDHALDVLKAENPHVMLGTPLDLTTPENWEHPARQQ